MMLNLGNCLYKPLKIETEEFKLGSAKSVKLLCLTNNHNLSLS